MIFIALVGLVLITGTDASRTTDQDYGQSLVLGEKPKIILAVGDIACSPDHKNFNSRSDDADVECQHQAVVDAMNKEVPDLTLILGDIQYDNGEYDNFMTVFIPTYQKLKSHIMAVPGNHEYYGSMTAEGYRLAFSEGLPSAQALSPEGLTYHSKTLGEWKVIGLDSDCWHIGGCDENSEQGKWLKKELEDSKNIKCTLAFWHHPVLTNGMHQTSDKDLGKPFLKQLYNAKAELVLNGHEHFYERFARINSDGIMDSNGVRQFTVGTGGRSLYGYKSIPQLPHEAGQTEDYGYLKLYLHNKYYRWEFKNVENKVLDRGKDICK